MHVDARRLTGTRCKMQFDAGRRPASRCTMQASQAALSLHLDAASASCVPWNAIWAAADRKIFPEDGLRPRAAPGAAHMRRYEPHRVLRNHASGIFYHFLITGEGGGTVLISWSGSNTSKLSTLHRWSALRPQLRSACTRSRALMALGAGRAQLRVSPRSCAARPPAMCRVPSSVVCVACESCPSLTPRPQL